VPLLAFEAFGFVSFEESFSEPLVVGRSSIERHQERRQASEVDSFDVYAAYSFSSWVTFVEAQGFCESVPLSASDFLSREILKTELEARNCSSVSSLILIFFQSFSSIDCSSILELLLLLRSLRLNPECF